MVKIGFFKAEVSCLHWNLTYVLANHISYCIWCLFPNFQWSWNVVVIYSWSDLIFIVFMLFFTIFILMNFHSTQFINCFFEKKDFSYLMIISYVVAISHISNFNDVCYPIQFLLFWLITSDINCHLFSSDSSHSNKMANALKKCKHFWRRHSKKFLTLKNVGNCSNYKWQKLVKKMQTIF